MFAVLLTIYFLSFILSIYYFLYTFENNYNALLVDILFFYKEIGVVIME